LLILKSKHLLHAMSLQRGFATFAIVMDYCVIAPVFRRFFD